MSNPVLRFNLDLAMARLDAALASSMLSGRHHAREALDAYKAYAADRDAPSEADR